MAILQHLAKAVAPVTRSRSSGCFPPSDECARTVIVKSFSWRRKLSSSVFNGHAAGWENTSARTRCSSGPAEDTEESEFLDDLRVPQAWVVPEVAAQEAEWLRGALHQWLDDEYCPEPANEEISKRCSKVFYYCLLEQQLDVGDILMQMVRGLETFSFKESFHGAFSSANAAVDLITKRMRSLENKTY
ncbi:hypothetical protein MPTK1_1g00910 [Marchantia polymorpha subsp. ruderalis]|nr:hypothetical protein MARPO_0275s0001 [Marchantia polymorpha]PTQ42671.1 hypothetical protein MARPO_0029s0155 [Marchantia polymorpha]PTQ42672.1 hypothetical protein MARPO_0029s0155 [Marchantia polymorpha]BBM96811.1 hypothetical protein Mp_1g00900 [Marchantia polymorpha subsp. ruderalis]BBM96812.1 hypothetical protein Mp_1g00910 [Marchantia polymorpha subsp. ruderalis]|eukprot:PTQ26899.1 hypothetical protein MARPO_0275s0001 [Marchantia polymorpha]